MQAAVVDSGALEWRTVPDPVPGPGQLLVEVHAAGVNNADLIQRLGLYPPPAGWPEDVPGLELAGRVVARGPGCGGPLAAGDRVMGLVGGGAQAELAVMDEAEALAVPTGTPWEEAGGFPEAFSTAYDALVTQGGLVLGDRVLVTGAAGGVGTAGVQLAAAAGAEVVASVRRPELCQALVALGAARAEEPAAAAALGPFDVVLELVGGDSFALSLEALAVGGRLVVIGTGAGGRAEIDLLGLMRRRATVRGSTMRARPAPEKALVARAVGAHVVPLLADGRVRVPIAETFALSDAPLAYDRFAAGAKLGKVVLVRR
ncbi:MAG: zinc-binding dehydrogenase [Acidobacteriota bacterium]|nr:zinc-binding dehydrogenase [Acidobacteriota bacterium]